VAAPQKLSIPGPAFALDQPLTGGNRIGIMAGAAQPMSDAEIQAYLQELYH
jgi:hypothetical protein